MSTYSAGHYEEGSGIGWKVFAVFAGFLIPFVMAVGRWLAVSAHNASSDARNAAASAKAASATTSSSSSMSGVTAGASTAGGSVATPSFAGAAPAHAAGLAMSHAAAPATLPAAPAGAVARIRLDMRHSTISIAPASTTTPGCSTAPHPAPRSTCVWVRPCK
jgi:hypothetical protein